MYVLQVAVIMLNLVIAIMGNSFDKVQETMEKEQLRNLSVSCAVQLSLRVDDDMNEWVCILTSTL